MSDAEFQWEVPESFNFAVDVVDYWARDPQRLALIAVNDAGDERSFTFSDISEASCRLANLLTAQGLNKGDRVVVMLPRIAQWQIAMVAVMRLGAVPIPCITMLTEKDLAYRVQHSGAVGVVTLSEEASKFEGIDGLIARICVGDDRAGWMNAEQASMQSEVFEPASVDSEDPAILYFTSGSTGSPKGVTHSSRAIWAWRLSAEHWLGLTPQSRIWCTADTGWSKAGTSILFGPWSQGASVLFYDGPFDPNARLALLEKFEVSCFCAAATELRRLILEDVSKFDLKHLTTTVSAGESVNPEVIERWRALTGTTVLDGYGQTETLMTITNRPDREVKPGSMGLPLPGLTVGVYDVDKSSVAPRGEGELVLALPYPQLMLGYWQDPDRTRDSRVSVDDADWYRTGDNVAIDDDGYVFYTGRADDIINSSGYRIGPQEVENALSEHAAVLECAVVGVPDDERGELVKAWIVLAPDFTPSDELVRELQDHAKATTAPYKYPRSVAFAEDLPKTVSGKIRRNLLRERG